MEEEEPELSNFEYKAPSKTIAINWSGSSRAMGRTLVGFVAENIARGSSRNVWISVILDLHKDAKRDLHNLRLDSYADENCFNLGKLPYDGSLSGMCPQGIMFITYQTLVSKYCKRQTWLDHLIEWCGGKDFDGFVMFDECHRTKTIELDANRNPKMEGHGICKHEKSSQTAIKVVQLQQALHHARMFTPWRRLSATQGTLVSSPGLGCGVTTWSIHWASINSSSA